MSDSPTPVLDYAGKTGRKPPPGHRAVRLLVMLACLYLPYSWLLFIDYPWSDYHRHWLKMWPVLPGLIAGVFVIPRDPLAEYLAMGLMTAAVVAAFGSLAWLGSRWVFRIAALLALAGSAVNAWVAYAVFRA